MYSIHINSIIILFFLDHDCTKIVIILFAVSTASSGVRQHYTVAFWITSYTPAFDQPYRHTSEVQTKSLFLAFSFNMAK